MLRATAINQILFFFHSLLAMQPHPKWLMFIVLQSSNIQQSQHKPTSKTLAIKTITKKIINEKFSISIFKCWWFIIIFYLHKRSICDRSLSSVITPKFHSSFALSLFRNLNYFFCISPSHIPSQIPSKKCDRWSSNAALQH